MPEGDCCEKFHYFKDIYNVWRFCKDEDVCERERRWREYVRKRDRNDNFPFDCVRWLNNIE